MSAAADKAEEEESKHSTNADHDGNHHATHQSSTELQNIKVKLKDVVIDNCQYQALTNGDTPYQSTPVKTEKATISPLRYRHTADKPVIVQFVPGRATEHDQIVKYYQYSRRIHMKLDYGFRSIYEMYRFNYRPSIFTALSIISIYLPSLLFPKGHIHPKLLFYIHIFFVAICLSLILCCLIKAAAACCKKDGRRLTTEQQLQKRRNHESQTSVVFPATDTDIDQDEHDEDTKQAAPEPSELDSDDIESGDKHDAYARNATTGEPAIHRLSSADSEHRRYSTATTLEQSSVIRFFYRFCEQFNEIFTIMMIDSKIKIASKVAPTFAGLLLVFVVLCCHLCFATVTREYGVGVFQLCQDITYVNAELEDTSMDDLEVEIGEGMCLARKSSHIECEFNECDDYFGGVYLVIRNQTKLSAKFGILFVHCNVINYFYMSVANRIEIKERKQKVVNACETKKKVIQKIQEDINHSVKTRILDKLTLRAMAKSIFVQTVMIGLLLLYHGVRFGYYEHTKNATAIWLSLFGTFNTWLNCVVLINTTQRFVIQYKYVQIVMRKFSKPIYCTSIDDIIAWWQFRRVYRENDIKAFSNMFHPIVSWLLLLTVVFVLYIAIDWVLWGDSYKLTPDEHVIFITIAYFCYAVLILCDCAVRVHKEQTERNCGILDREMIHCKRNLNGKIDVSLIQDIRQEIWKNSKPIVLIGVPMHNGTMTALRAYFASALGALVADWYLGST